MNETSSLPSAAPMSRRGTILYEAQNLVVKGGTGIATYARNLAEAAGRLGFNVDGLFGVEHGLAQSDGRLNEILAFDAVDDDKRLTPLEVAWRNVRYPFNALGGVKPVELARSGLIVGPTADTLRSFRRLFAATQLIDVCRAHFSIYGRLAQLRVEERPAIFHATHPVPLALRGCPNIYTIHDLVPIRLPYATMDNKKYFYRLLTTLARTADHIVTVSEYSRRDIIKYLGVDERRVTNTYQAVTIPSDLLARSDDDVAEDLAKLFGLDFGKYFLFFGAIEPKKNVGRLIDAYSASGSKLPLILASSAGWQNRADLKKIRDERFSTFRISDGVVRRERQVRRLEYMPQGQLSSLIRGATAVLFPSIYEGFGLPVIEAMALGTPVMTSNAASLPEVAAEAALIVDPYSVTEMAHAIRTLEADADLRTALVKRGHEQAKRFTPNAYDERLKRLYDSILRPSQKPS
ncbi:Glycosyltransferase involved in cell wall bisynthesis [Enhydrobacter aerosaccus]|uniref:Glycosyltransferase involved in cell wall bisynthesis n=1 Tax=Enhydrobacter aerosaccus TaxID=225324 RepID=A0A1T4T7N3_9HYPH|nr:glycosyltransferase [Enhydrobacter aerosaccus]SKA36241.1 Glycosyltransferase involved in cell wall bisynthesis [Enhydrobacter aerosaccus]